MGSNVTISRAGEIQAPVLDVSRRTRRTPWSTRVEAAGVQGYTVYNHMLLPTRFRGVEEDYWHLRRSVQIWDVGCERQVEIAGPDAGRLAQLLTTRDLSGAAAGRCLYAPLCDPEGGVVNDPILLKLADDRYWLSVADADVVLWARGIAFGLGLEVGVEEPEVWPLAVQGPHAEDLVAAVLGEAVREIRFFHFVTMSFGGRPLIVSRSGWSHQGGFEVYVDDGELGGQLWDALWAAGQPMDVRPGCPNLIERIEAGLLSYGNDMTRENTPLECDLDRYCALDAPIEFLGKDAIRRQRDAGVPRRVRGVEFDGPPCPPCVEPWPVVSGERLIGQITSAAWSPRLRRNVAIGMVDAGRWDPGTTVVVETPDGPRPGTVSLLPFPS